MSLEGAMLVQPQQASSAIRTYRSNHRRATVRVVAFPAVRLCIGLSALSRAAKGRVLLRAPGLIPSRAEHPVVLHQCKGMTMAVTMTVMTTVKSMAMTMMTV